MSLWGATVITGLLRVINIRVVYWLWGNLWVSLPTITFFYSLHFLLPFIVVGIIIVHIVTLHTPLRSTSYQWKRFHPWFSIKDRINLIPYLILLILVRVRIAYLFEPVNFEESNISVRPIHILPEWYFLWAYAILRCIPNKLIGVLALLARLVVILTWNGIKINSTISNRIKRLLFILILINLVELGGFPVEDPFILVSQLFTFLYFIVSILFSLLLTRVRYLEKVTR